MTDPLPDIAPCPAPLPDALPDAPTAPAALPGLGPPPLVLDDAGGVHVLGPATVDSDADGRPDTAVLDLTAAMADPADDALLLATDLDADGHVDAATTVAADGRAVTGTRDPEGRFAPGWDGGGGAGPDPAPDGAWNGGEEGAAPPAPSIDPVTGAWTRTP